jgi:hypothetical protein
MPSPSWKRVGRMRILIGRGVEVKSSLDAGETVILSPVPVGGTLPPHAGYFCMLNESAPEIGTLETRTDLQHSGRPLPATPICISATL